jgi:hypothetical protein
MAYPPLQSGGGGPCAAWWRGHPSNHDSPLPRPVSGLAFVSVGKRGALSVPLYFILRRVHRAPPVLSPRMGGPGSSRRSRLAPGGAGGRVRRALPARPSPRPGPVVGRFPPSHATVARPTRTPSPSPTPRSGAGFPQGRWGDYGLRGAALDKLRRRKIRKCGESRSWRERSSGIVHDWRSPLLRFPSTCSGTSPLANAGKRFLSRKGRDRARSISRFRKAPAFVVCCDGRCRRYLPPCGGESNFDGLVERSEGQTSEIAREGIASAPRGMCHSDMDPRVALRFASLALG